MRLTAAVFIGRAVTAAGALALAVIDVGTLAAESQRPNILFIFTDDQPQICMGCMGNERIQTPNMDRLAADRGLEGAARAVELLRPGRVQPV